jgi:hypothetical protein
MNDIDPVARGDVAFFVGSLRNDLVVVRYRERRGWREKTQ